MPEYIENRLSEYSGVITQIWHLWTSWRLRFRLSGATTQMCALTTSRELRLGNYVSRCWVYHPSQALVDARELCSLMYGVPPPHSILEEDSRYLRNDLGTRTTTYWLPNTWESQAALLESLVPDENAHWYLQYTELARETAMSQGLNYILACHYVLWGLLSDIWARGTYTARICDHRQAFGQAAIKEEAHKG